MLNACGASDAEPAGDGSSAGNGSTASVPPPGLSRGLHCDGAGALQPASVTAEIGGRIDRFEGVVSGGDDSVSVRVVCSNPDDLTETLGLLLSFDVDGDISAQTYTTQTPAPLASDAAEGAVALKGVRGSYQVNHSSKGIALQGAEDGEKYWDLWQAGYETTFNNHNWLPADDATKAQLAWTDEFVVEITHAEKKKDSETQAVSPITGRPFDLSGYIYHGVISIKAVPTKTTEEVLEPDREPATLRAEF